MRLLARLVLVAIATAPITGLAQPSARRTRATKLPARRARPTPPVPSSPRPLPTPAIAPGPIAPHEPDALGDDLPEIEETEFSNASQYRKGQSTLIAVAGISFPNQEEAAPRPVYGVEFNYRYRHNLALALSGLYSSEETKKPLGEFRFNVAYVGIAALYDAPEQYLPGMHIGPAFYLAHVDYLSRTFATEGATTGPSASAKGLTIAVGPKVGFKIPLFWKIATQIETAILYSPPVEAVPAFVTVNFSSGIRFDF